MSLKSMTGFGSSTFSNKDISLSIEVKTVNSRYLDISFKIPASYSKLENKFSSLIKSKLKRSRLDLNIQRKLLSESSYNLDFNQSLFDSYYQSVKTKAEKEKISDANLHAFKFSLNQKDIFTQNSETLVDAEQEILLETLEQALDSLVLMREKEGLNLEREILKLKQDLNAELLKIKQEVQNFNQVAKDKLDIKLEKFKNEVDFDEQRIAQELALIIDRSDITEEITRIESHLEQLALIISSEQGGRKIEFLLQELFREVNTIGSKSQSSNISKSVIESKSIIDKIKEQTANVE